MPRWLEGVIASAILALASYLFLWFVTLEPNPLRWSELARGLWVALTAWLYYKAMQRAE